jgi:hypothetical protein
MSLFSDLMLVVPGPCIASIWVSYSHTSSCCASTLTDRSITRSTRTSINRRIVRDLVSAMSDVTSAAVRLRTSERMTKGCKGSRAFIPCQSSHKAAFGKTTLVFSSYPNFCRQLRIPRLKSNASWEHSYVVTKRNESLRTCCCRRYRPLLLGSSCR